MTALAPGGTAVRTMDGVSQALRGAPRVARPEEERRHAIEASAEHYRKVAEQLEQGVEDSRHID